MPTSFLYFSISRFRTIDKFESHQEKIIKLIRSVAGNFFVGFPQLSRSGLIWCWQTSVGRENVFLEITWKRLFFPKKILSKQTWINV